MSTRFSLLRKWTSGTAGYRNNSFLNNYSKLRTALPRVWYIAHCQKQSNWTLIFWKWKRYEIELQKHASIPCVSTTLKLSGWYDIPTGWSSSSLCHCCTGASRPKPERPLDTRAGLIPWLLRLLYLTLCNYVLRGYLKCVVFHDPFKTIEDLKNKVIQAIQIKDENTLHNV